ncbi:MAG: hypothetical protein JWR48_7363 [Mycobacterium sp.]|jgi:hypothetical protein|nr:hypothetical protein [Mycobacterium sp.]
MQTTSDIPSDTEMARQRRGATRFFWMWLIVATAMSVTGNVAHAVLRAASGTVALAAGAALVIGIRRCQSRPNTPKQCGIGGWPKATTTPRGIDDLRDAEFDAGEAKPIIAAADR